MIANERVKKIRQTLDNTTNWNLFRQTLDNTTNWKLFRQTIAVLSGICKFVVLSSV
jgi:uncharacterized membrane protein